MKDKIPKNVKKSERRKQKQDLSLLKSLKEEFGKIDVVFKNKNFNGDVDIILSSQNYKRLRLGKNFVLLSNRAKCDKHIFYIYEFEGYFYTLDFNLDGLSKPGYYSFDMSVIWENAEVFKGMYFLAEGFYNKYSKVKKRGKLKLNLFPSYIKSLLFRYEKFNFKKFKIAFVGLDGSGKSTIVNELSHNFQHNPFIQYMGWKDFVNPFVAFYRNIFYREVKSKEKQIQISSNIRKISLLKITVYYIELWTRWLKIFFLKDKMIIFYDRYFFDWLILVENNLVKKFFSFITPKVDLIVYLTAPAKVLWKRKQEVSYGKLQKLNDEYLKYFLGKKNVLIIDTSKNDVESTKQKIIEVIKTLKR